MKTINIIDGEKVVEKVKKKKKIIEEVKKEPVKRNVIVHFSTGDVRYEFASYAASALNVTIQSVIQCCKLNDKLAKPYHTVKGNVVVYG